MKVHIGVFTLNLQVDWVDQDREQLEHIQRFLLKHNITGRLGETWTQGRKYFELSVMQSDNSLEALKRMLPCVDKKSSQVSAAIDYLENQITGEKFIGMMNEAVICGKRSSTVKSVKMPYTKAQGLLLAMSSHRWGKRRVLTIDQVKAMRHDREVLGMSFGVLAIQYGIALSTAHRALTKYLGPMKGL